MAKGKRGSGPMRPMGTKNRSGIKKLAASIGKNPAKAGSISGNAGMMKPNTY